ncbi:hypothetical protein E2C01_006759 [Portunus trituberculatus]|uniref:Uncharacterized protein n=1 Tax=Portunus trituberculatus TaxID=210409 RepID=A0A5B7D0I5_PORTR|nr:hypothetical protein [Portunus trituberculatus]
MGNFEDRLPRILQSIQISLMSIALLLSAETPQVAINEDGLQAGWQDSISAVCCEDWRVFAVDITVLYGCSSGRDTPTNRARYRSGSQRTHVPHSILRTLSPASTHADNPTLIVTRNSSEHRHPNNNFIFRFITGTFSPKVTYHCQ